MNERNKRAYDEIDVKPITQKTPDAKNYNPKSYLTPYA
jgi:hypothetical protein